MTYLGKELLILNELRYFGWSGGGFLAMGLRNFAVSILWGRNRHRRRRYHPVASFQKRLHSQNANPSLFSSVRMSRQAFAFQKFDSISEFTCGYYLLHAAHFSPKFKRTLLNLSFYVFAFKCELFHKMNNLVGYLGNQKRTKQGKQRENSFK
jgi:hypothetical protein